MTLVAVADRTSPVVRVFDGRGETAKAVAQVRVHAKPVTALRYNPAMDTVISIDSAGVIDYWSPGADYGVSALCTKEGRGESSCCLTLRLFFSRP